MTAELLILSGTRAGESVPVPERLTIGGDPRCDLRVDGPGVAPFHAVIARARTGYNLAVVDGASEVLVNNIARREGRLYHGHRLLVGGVELQFLSVATRNPNDTWADFGAGDTRPGAPDVERVWKSERYSSKVFDKSALERSTLGEDRLLRGLYLVGHAATAERSSARALERAADAVVAALRPDRLVVALYDKPKDQLVSAVVRRGILDHKGAKIPVSRGIVRKGAVEGVSVLTHVRREGEESERSIVCAPLSTRTEPVGAIYLEHRPGGPSFSDEDLDFLGAVGRILGLSVERTRAEASARSRGVERDRDRSRWDAVVQGLGSGVLIVDGEGRVELANPAAREILEHRLAVHDPSGMTQLGGLPLAELAARAEPGRELEVVLPGSPEVVLEVRPSPVLDPDGQRAGAALLIDDRTGDRMNQARLVQAEKLSSLGEMLAGVAHEINNPLATILGYAEMLSRKAPPDQRQALDAILEESERCRRIVSSLLAFARPTRGERTLLDLAAVVGSVLDLLAHEFRVARIEVSRELDGSLRVLADRYELQQVFFNLVKNALDAIRNTGLPGKVVVSGRLLATAPPPGVAPSERTDRVRIEVRDSGPGFPPSALGKLVPRPFFTTKGESGTGLGLSIAHGIVSSLGGTIEAGVAPERGALVAVELPATAEPPVAPPASAAESAAPGDGAPGRKVLIVDDEAHVRDVLSQIVRELGHVPVSAASGSEALERIDQEPDVQAILSDIRMPGMGGDDLWRALHGQGHRLASRLVFLSGDLARAETAQFLKETGRPVLAKPFRIAQVCRVVEDVLGDRTGVAAR